ncbi:MAG: formylglycine-generating enzyme family protein [Planctomycetes bacterium]|nr:formylglycine-generating enzyme family protein [Planctomycetota bacterium]
MSNCLVRVLSLGVVGFGLAVASAAPPPPLCVAPFPADQAKRHQVAWARHLDTPVEERNTVGMTLVLLPPGEFMMGSTADQAEAAAKLVPELKEIVRESELTRLRKEEQPRHRVVLTRPFRIGATEVTRGQFRQFVEAAKYVTETERFGGGNSALTAEKDPKKKAATWQEPGYKATDAMPVTQITLGDMLAFCNWLSEKERLTPCYRQEKDAWKRIETATGYRLPTEAEWEYACRAGTDTQYSFGDDSNDLKDYAWFNKNADRIGAGEVGTKRPNAWGLFDMHGNAWERCQDWHDAQWYAKSPAENPQGPETGSRTVVRGGGWHYFALHCRSAYRNNYALNARTANTGFRVVRAVPSGAK